MQETFKTNSNSVSLSNVFIKSRLSFKRIFFMAATGLKTRRVRLAFSMILSIMTFVIFGLAITAAFANPLQAELQALHNAGNRMVRMYRYVEYTDYFPYFSVDLEGNMVVAGYFRNTVRRNLEFTDQQMQQIVAFNGREPLVVLYASYAIRAPISHAVGSSMFGLSRYYQMAGSTRGAIPLNPATGMADANLRPDPRLNANTLNRLPESFTEVAISDISADFFLRFGIGDTQFDKIDDIIGTSLLSSPDLGAGNLQFTISGIFATCDNRTYFRRRLHDSRPNPLHNSILGLDSVTNLLNSFMAQHYFVQEGFIEYMEAQGLLVGSEERTRSDRWLVQLTGSMRHDRSFFNSFSYRDGNRRYGVGLYSSMTLFMSDIDMVFPWLIIGGLIATAVCAVFAIILMMNFLTISLSTKKREMGILRAMGARRKDILMICLLESALILVINLIVACVSIVIWSLVFNTFFYVPIMQFGIVQMLLLVALATITTAFATLIPVLKVTNKKPVDIIKEQA